MKYYHTFYILIAIFISCQTTDNKQVVDEYHSIITKSGKPIVSTSEKVLDHFQKASAYFDNKSFKEAHIEILLALEIEPKNSGLLNQIGLILTKLRKYDEAESFLMKSILYDSLYINPYVNLSQLYIWNKEFSKSIEVSKLLLENTIDEKALFPSNYQLCQAYTNLKKCELANKYYDIASNYAMTEIEQTTLKYYKVNFLDRKCNTKWFKPMPE